MHLFVLRYVLACALEWCDALKAEERLARVSGEAAEAQAAAAAAKAAGRELNEKVAAAAREAGLRRDEVSRLRGELERSRAACAQKVCRCSKVLRSLTKNIKYQCFSA